MQQFNSMTLNQQTVNLLDVSFKPLFNGSQQLKKHREMNSFYSIFAEELQASFNLGKFGQLPEQVQAEYTPLSTLWALD